MRQNMWKRNLDNRSVVRPKKHVEEEGSVLRAVGEVPAHPEHELLFDGALQAVVPLLAVAVLLRARRVGRLGLEAIVSEQARVPARKLFERVEVVHGRREPVGPVLGRHPTQLPEGILKTLGEALKTF